MFAGQERGGIGREDILESARTIRRSQSANDFPDDVIDSTHIGSRFINEWRKPVTEYGQNNPEWEVKLKWSPYVGDIDFGRRSWARSRDAVDTILKLILIEIKANAEAFEGLKIEIYVRMGSSRDGLKVIAPDEFDTLLQFHIEGFNYEAVPLRHNGKIVSEYCYIEGNKSMEYLKDRYPGLYKYGVFEEIHGAVKLNARQLHQVVFASLVDQAVDKITQKVQEEVTRSGKPATFEIKRRVSPHTINITILLDDATFNSNFMAMEAMRNASDEVRQIDVDIVPALVIRNDQQYTGRIMDFPVYAVFKWSEPSSVQVFVFPKPDIVWRVSTSGYERNTLDLARCDKRQRYILTALRIMKTYFKKAKSAGNPPRQITTFFRSYDLKHIAFYVIMYVCHINKNASVKGVEDALIYFIRFMKSSLEMKRLPSFFHSNRLIKRIYPDYPTIGGQVLRLNLLSGKSDEAFNQAKMSLKNHLWSDLGFRFDGYDNTLSQIVHKYEGELAYGEFF